MTRIYLTDEDYSTLHKGDLVEIGALFTKAYAQALGMQRALHGEGDRKPYITGNAEHYINVVQTGDMDEIKHTLNTLRQEMAAMKDRWHEILVGLGLATNETA